MDKFTFHRYFYEALKDLPTDLKIEVYDSILEYALNGKETAKTGAAKSIFNLLKMKIDADKKKAINGKKGGRPKKTKKTKVKSESPSVERIDYNKLVEYFNTTTKGVFGNVKTPISETRRGMINGRIKEHGKKAFTEVINLAMNSDFLKGQSGRFKMTFDWMIRPTNFEKILSRNYGNNNGYNSTSDEELANGIAAGIARGSTPQEY